MIGFKLALIAAVAALSVTAAPAAVAHAVSDNQIIEESLFDESTVPDEMSDQSVDLDEEAATVSDNNIPSADTGVSSDQEQESTGDVGSDQVGDEYGVMPLADYETYYGSISTTYVEYFRGYLAKLQPSEHYVAARTGQYQYIFAYGSELQYDGTFSGQDIYVVRINTQNNGTFSGGIETTFSLDPGSYLVYTDLSPVYPSLATSADLSLQQIVFVLAIVIVFYTLTKMMQPGIVKSHSRRWKR